MRMGGTTEARSGNRALAVVVLSGALTLSGAGFALAQQETGPPQEPEGGVTDQMMTEAVREFSPTDHIREYSIENHIAYLGEAEAEEEDVIVLETDILFAALEWELPASADSPIAELTEEVPDGASVQVHGHTDSNPVPDRYDFDNQLLSENRAEAVAEVLEGERPDLELNVEGFGEDQPAVEEDEDDPSTFAANRRVEIRYD